MKIFINVSNFLTWYRTIAFFKEEKNLSGLLIGKKLSVSKATCPESVFKTVQIILWETPVTKYSQKVFINVNRVRVLPLRTNLASFFNNKIKRKKFRSVRVQNVLYYFILSGFLFTLNFKYFFNSWCYILDYFILNCKLWDKFLFSMISLFFNYLLYSNLLQKFWISFWICGTEEGPPYVAEMFAFLSFCAILNLIVIILIKEIKKKLTLCHNNEKWTINLDLGSTAENRPTRLCVIEMAEFHATYHHFCN